MAIVLCLYIYIPLHIYVSGYIHIHTHTYVSPDAGTEQRCVLWSLVNSLELECIALLKRHSKCS